MNTQHPTSTPPPTPRKRYAWLLGAGGLFLLAVGVMAFYGLRYPDQPGPDDGPQTPIGVTILDRTSVSKIAQMLAVKRLIRFPVWFHLYAKLSGNGGHIHAGQHALSAHMTPREILAQLTEWPPTGSIRVTIPEGKNMFEVVQLLDQAGVCPLESGLAFLRTPWLLQEVGLAEHKSFEGYLFPATYFFKPNQTCVLPLTAMVEKHRQVFAQLQAKYAQAMQTLQTRNKWGPHQIVTLASIIEKEAGKDERPLIASVFFNRLHFPNFVPHRLDSDPTVSYGCISAITKTPACKTFDGRLHSKQLEDRENPYNTYRHEGLPPGPIANPGRAALEAVLQPATSNYLFFVSRNDHTHQFSATLSDHTAAVKKYQRGP